MQQRTVEDYIREMEKMKARAALPMMPTEDNIDEEKTVQPIAENEADTAAEPAKDEGEIKSDAIGMGRLSVSVTTGGGVFPIENASVIVSSYDQNEGAEIAAVKTDASGKTPLLYLPAPSREKSQNPQQDGTQQPTRAQYNITVTAPGYVSAVVEGISVFDGVTAIQKVDMLTVSAADGNTAPRVVNEQTVYQL